MHGALCMRPSRSLKIGEVCALLLLATRCGGESTATRDPGPDASQQTTFPPSGAVPTDASTSLPDVTVDRSSYDSSAAATSEASGGDGSDPTRCAIEAATAICCCAIDVTSTYVCVAGASRACLSRSQIMSRATAAPDCQAGGTATCQPSFALHYGEECRTDLCGGPCSIPCIADADDSGLEVGIAQGDAVPDDALVESGAIDGPSDDCHSDTCGGPCSSPCSADAGEDGQDGGEPTD